MKTIHNLWLIETISGGRWYTNTEEVFHTRDAARASINFYKAEDRVHHTLFDYRVVKYVREEKCSDSKRKQQARGKKK